MDKIEHQYFSFTQLKSLFFIIKCNLQYYKLQ